MRVTNFRNILLMAWFVSLFSACEHKPLYSIDEPAEGDPTLVLAPVYIDFDWSKLEEGDNAPEGMTVFAYPTGTTNYKKYDIPTSHDGMINLPVGDIRLVFVNNDNNNVYPDKYSNFLTNQYILVNNLANLNMLYGGCRQVVISKSDKEAQHIVLTPQCVCKHINLTFTNLNTTCQNAKFHRVGVTGLANAITANNLKVSDVAEPIMMRKNLKSSETALTGSMRCLGIVPDVYTHKVILAAYNANGGVTAYRFYVTDEIKSQALQHVINLELDILDGEELDEWDSDYVDITKDDAKGGFVTDIDDFEEEIIDTDM